MIFIAYGLLTVNMALVATGMLSGWHPLFVYAIAVTDVIPLTLVRPTHNALLPSLARSPSELTAANAVTSIAEATGILLGPLGAAAILVVAGPGAVVGVLAGVAGLAALLVFGLRPNASGVSSQALVDDAIDSPTAGFAVLGGFRALAADSDARLVVAVLSARQLMIGVTDVLFVLLAIQVFGTGESGAAVMSAAIGAGGILGGALAFGLIGRHRIAPVLVASGALFGATFAAIGFSGGVYAPLLLVIGGIGLALMDVAGRTILQRAVRDEVLASVFGILEGMMMAALALGSILVPIVVALTGTDGAILVFAAMLPLIVVLTFPGLRAIDRRAGVPVRELTLLRLTPLLQAMPIPSLEGLARAAAWVSAPGRDGGHPRGRPRRDVLHRGVGCGRGVARWAAHPDAGRRGRRLRRDRAPARHPAHGDGHGDHRHRAADPRPARVPGRGHGPPGGGRRGGKARRGAAARGPGVGRSRRLGSEELAQLDGDAGRVAVIVRARVVEPVEGDPTSMGQHAFELVERGVEEGRRLAPAEEQHVGCEVRVVIGGVRHLADVEHVVVERRDEVEDGDVIGPVDADDGREPEQRRQDEPRDRATSSDRCPRPLRAVIRAPRTLPSASSRS